MTSYIGYLPPNGELIECESYGHTSLALDLVEKMKDVPAEFKTNGVKAEEYLLSLGYIAVRARDAYGKIGYFVNENSERRIHMTEAQKTWLLEHYGYFAPEKQRCVDELFRWDGSGGIRERI